MLIVDTHCRATELFFEPIDLLLYQKKHDGQGDRAKILGGNARKVFLIRS
jgi:hypothetical protein